MRIITQIDYVQIRRSITEWKKFQKKIIKFKLIDYENDYIYRMLIFKKAIKGYFNVKWINNLSNTTNSVMNDENVKLFAQKFRIDDDINVLSKQFLNCIRMFSLQNVKIFQSLKLFTSKIMFSKQIISSQQTVSSETKTSNRASHHFILLILFVNINNVKLYKLQIYKQTIKN